MSVVFCPECYKVKMGCASYTFVEGSDDYVEYEETWICPECGKTVRAKVCLYYS